MNHIEFFVPGEPKAQPRPRAFALRGRGGKVILSKTGEPIIRAYESGTAEAWKSAIAIAVREFVPMPPLSCPLRVDLEFIFPRPKSHFRANGELKPSAPIWHTIKPDRDNLDKAVLDALTTIGLWDDDSQVCSGELTKCYAGLNQSPGARITITPLTQPVAEMERKPEAMELRLEGAV